LASAVNPLFTSLIPGGANPSGASVSVPSPPLTGTTGNPYINTPVPGGANTPVSRNPYDMNFSAYTPPVSSLPTIGGAPTPYSAVPGSPNTFTGGGVTGAYGTMGGPLGLGESSQGFQSLQSTLDKTYGAGTGNALVQFLASGAGYSPQVLQQLFAQLQPGFEQQQQNLLQQFSAGGGRFSSTAATGYADLLSQQGLDMGDIAAQLYEQAVSNYMNILGQAGTASANMKANQPSTWDVIGSALGLTGDVAGAASQAAPDDTLLSILSNL
jgi:hypothetical protein